MKKKKKKKIQLKNKSECDFFNVYFEGIFLYTGKNTEIF